MSKALTLALALAAGQARADGLVVSALFGTEPPSYVHAAVANVLGFTLPTTKIVVHLSTASLAKPDSFTDPRVSINPDRQHTSSATGMVTRQRERPEASFLGVRRDLVQASELRLRLFLCDETVRRRGVRRDRRDLSTPPGTMSSIITSVGRRKRPVTTRPSPPDKACLSLSYHDRKFRNRFSRFRKINEIP